MRTITFEAGGKEYTVKFDINSVCDIEEAAGRTPIQVLCGQDNIGYNTIRLLLQHGLKHRNPGITKQRAGELIAQYIKEGGTLDKLSRDILLLLAESTGSKIKKELLDEIEDEAAAAEEEETEDQDKAE